MKTNYSLFFSTFSLRLTLHILTPYQQSFEHFGRTLLSSNAMSHGETEREFADEQDCRREGNVDCLERMNEK